MGNLPAFLEYLTVWKKMNVKLLKKESVHKKKNVSRKTRRLKQDEYIRS